MGTRDDLESWARGNSIPAVTFRQNDLVRVILGTNAGRFGVVVSLERIQPDVSYLIEFGDDGSDAIIAQSMLERVNSAS